MSDRILWNRRPTSDRDAGDIDEIVIHGATVHVEQMDARCWWIGVYVEGTDRYWMGNFTADSRGRMRFGEQENAGIVWAHDASHETDDTRVDTFTFAIEAGEPIWYGDDTTGFQGVSRTYAGQGTTIDEAAGRVIQMIDQTKDEHL